MSTTTASPQIQSRIPPRVLTRWAGGLAIAHVVVMLGGFAVEGVASVEHGTSPSTIQHTFADHSLTGTFAAGYVESLAFVLLVPALVLVAQAFSRRTDLGRLASRTFLALGVAYVASTLAVGFPPGAAAFYAAHHGVDAGTIATVNDIRNYSFVLQVALMAAMAGALGIAALGEKRHTRWIGWGGLALGVVGLAVTPIAHNAISMAFLIWWVGMGVVLLREKDQLD
jgi:hypothetical protein